jgi:hypothetical protein
MPGLVPGIFVLALMKHNGEFVICKRSDAIR